jgi:methylated-DNA-[protein]-cysteine S-methyltransferase
MKPTLVQYDASGWGVGEVWLDRGRVFHSELPRPRAARGVATPAAPAIAELVQRLRAFFAGDDETFRGVRLAHQDGFYGDLVRVLRQVPRGEVVTYGELASLAGYPGAARAAGTFCGRCTLSPFVPTHRVVASDGIGSYGDLGIEYKRRLLALEDVAL